jgi:hypothetical protein
MYTIKTAKALLNNLADYHSITLQQSPDFGVVIPKEEAEAGRVEKFLESLEDEGFTKKQAVKSNVTSYTYTKNNLVVLVRGATATKYPSITGVDLVLDGKYTPLAEGMQFLAKLLPTQITEGEGDATYMQEVLDDVMVLLYNPIMGQYAGKIPELQKALQTARQAVNKLKIAAGTV